MQNEQTNKTDTTGTKVNTALATDGEPLSDYDRALALVIRREEATKAEESILERKERLAANQILGGNSGGHVDAPVVNEEDKKKQGAKEFFKGTQLEDAIDKL